MKITHLLCILACLGSSSCSQQFKDEYSAAMRKHNANRVANAGGYARAPRVNSGYQASYAPITIPSANINLPSPNRNYTGNTNSTGQLLNPYSQYGNKYSNKSWNNQYATNAPKIYDSNGKYRGRLSSNKYDSDSISNPYGRFGSKYSSESLNNPYGAGNPYTNQKIYIQGQ